MPPRTPRTKDLEVFKPHFFNLFFVKKYSLARVKKEFDELFEIIQTITGITYIVTVEQWKSRHKFWNGTWKIPNEHRGPFVAEPDDVRNPKIWSHSGLGDVRLGYVGPDQSVTGNTLLHKLFPTSDEQQSSTGLSHQQSHNILSSEYAAAHAAQLYQPFNGPPDSAIGVDFNLYDNSSTHTPLVINSGGPRLTHVPRFLIEEEHSSAPSSSYTSTIDPSDPNPPLSLHASVPFQTEAEHPLRSWHTNSSTLNYTGSFSLSHPQEIFHYGVAGLLEPQDADAEHHEASGQVSRVRF